MDENMNGLKCPDCGGEIEYGQKVCKNCGCALVFCRECGGVCTSGQPVCPECGAKFGAVDIAQAQDNETDPDKNENIIELWKRQNKTDKKISSIIDIAEICLWIVAGVFMIAAFVLLVINRDIGDALMELRGQAHGLIISACVLAAAVTVAGDMNKLYVCRRMGRWIAESGADFMPHLKSAYAKVRNTAEVETYMDEFENISSAAYLASHTQYGRDRIIWFAAVSALIIGLAVSAAFCLVQNADAYIFSRLFETDFTLKYISVISTVILGVAYCLARRALKRKNKNIMDSWLRSL